MQRVNPNLNYQFPWEVRGLLRVDRECAWAIFLPSIIRAAEGQLWRQNPVPLCLGS